MQSLANKRMVETGDTGNAGWGVVKATPDKGAQITVILRSRSAIETEAASHGNSISPIARV